MIIRILGGVEIHNGDRWVKAGTPKQQCVLASLSMAAGKSVTLEDLAHRVWGGSPPRSTRGILYGHITRLRDLLKAHPSVTLSRANTDGYRLDVTACEVDVFHMRDLVEQARGAAVNGDHAEAAQRWRAALDQWHGTPLSGVAGDWADRVRAGLAAERLAVLVGLFEAELELGHHHENLHDLEVAARAHPQAEVLTGLLMTALYRCDRAGDALDRYRRLSDRLRGSLGHEPGPGLRRLHQRILRNDTGLYRSVGGSREESASPRGPDVRPETDSPVKSLKQLPATSPAFTGRDGELARLTGWLRRAAEPAVSVASVSIIDGMPGVGKTALAVHAAAAAVAHYPEGQIFIDLHGYSAGLSPIDPQDVMHRVLTSLGTPANAIPEPGEQRAAAYRSALADHRMLLVFDNVFDEAQLRPLLPGLSGCAVLATSRRRMVDIDDVVPVALGPLDRVEAIRLFTCIRGVERTPADDAVLTEIVDLCGQLPLAIRIAAARLRQRPHWTLTSLRDKLSDEDRRLSELSSGERGVEMSMRVSFRHLPSDQQRLFRRLGRFPGPDFTAAAVGAIDDPVGAEPLLEELVDVNLIEAPRPGRYRMHDLVKVFVQDLAVDDDLESRLHAWYLYRSYSAGEQFNEMSRAFTLPPPPADLDVAIADSTTGRAWFTEEYANLLAVISAARRRGDETTAWQLAVLVSTHFCDVGDRHRLRRAVEVGMPAARSDEHLDAQATLHLHLGYAVSLGDDAETAIPHYREAVEVAREADNALVEAMALRRIGFFYYGQGRLEESMRFLRREEQVSGRLSPAQQDGSRDAIAVVAMDLGLLVEARDRWEEMLERLKERRDGKATLLGNLALVHARLGEFDLAWQREAEHDRILDRTGGGEFEQMLGLARKSYMHTMAENHDAARDAAVAAGKLIEAADLTAYRPVYLVALAASWDGNPEAAETAARQAIKAADQTGNQTALTRANAILATALTERRSPVAAMSAAETALSHARRTGHKLAQAEAYIAAARVHAAIDDLTEAVRLATTGLTIQSIAQHRPGQAITHTLLADLSDRLGDTTTTRRHREAAVELYTFMGNRHAVTRLTAPHR
ncbi:DNA-binding SARP family transcriptional activator [Stackebrandtia endophytica]|uniref:DNA-binding SARP family transcriptional activator n=1 Tax=Stackebrandtia endophytica TaxID=1496996 RepID=A0A543ASK6_9ACTN|nr:AfsR/SARP family transcriptional regulator [Stackebrandtia endophytica]TQL75536.1 DNA-binding SARP family transcriptional activator [Stackebrandtia endophytica]